MVRRRRARGVNGHVGGDERGEGGRRGEAIADGDVERHLALVVAAGGGARVRREKRSHHAHVVVGLRIGVEPLYPCVYPCTVRVRLPMHRACACACACASRPERHERAASAVAPASAVGSARPPPKSGGTLGAAAGLLYQPRSRGGATGPRSLQAPFGPGSNRGWRAPSRSDAWRTTHARARARPAEP